MTKKTTIILAVVAAIIVVAAAVGTALFIVKNNEKGPETKDSIVGCYFDYRVVGNYTADNYLLSGNVKHTVLQEDDTRYEIKTEVDTYYTDDKGALKEYAKDTITEWESKDKYLNPAPTYVDMKISTYWGEKDCKKYVVDDSSYTTITYQGYDGKVMLEQVMQDSSNLMVLMLQDTDFINYKKSETPHSYELDMDITGTGTAMFLSFGISGTEKIEYLDFTGTCTLTRITAHMVIEGLADETSTKTKWTHDDGSESSYGELTNTTTVNTEWGKLDVKEYSKIETDSGTTTTTRTYVYEDTVPVRITVYQVDSSTVMTMSFDVTKLIRDGKEVDDIDDALDW